MTTEIRIVVEGNVVASMRLPEIKWHGESGEWSLLSPDTHPQFADPLAEFARELREVGFEVIEITRDQPSHPGRIY